MNQLGDLLRARRDVLKGRGWTVEKIAGKAELAASVIYFHLRQTEPFRQPPRQETLRKLAAGFGVRVDAVRAAAQEATVPVEGNPLALLLATRKAELGLTIPQMTAAAKEQGLSLSAGNLSNVLSGRNLNPSVATLRTLATVLDLDVGEVQAAAKQARGQFTYRLPRHIEDRLTPERWSKLVKIVEATLDLDDR